MAGSTGTGAFDNLGYYADFWSSTEYDAAGVYLLNVHKNSDIVPFNDFNIKEFGYSLRCVRDTGSLLLQSPIGGEKWKAGSSQNITWTSSNVGNVKIEYTIDNGTNWATVIAFTAASVGSYAWTAPSTVSTQCKVRISDANNVLLNNVSTFPFTISNITLQSPVAWENWTIGTLQNITWTSSLVESVKIEYTTDRGLNWSTVIESIPASEGSYVWTVPNTPSEHCMIRISDASNALVVSYMTDFFIISNITLQSPAGEENWQAGSSHNITWTSFNVTNIKIEYWTNRINWTTVIESIPASEGSYSWTVPNTISSWCQVRISDASNALVVSYAKNDFTISNMPCPGIPTVTYSNKTYNTVQIGSQCWLKENLDVGTRINGSLQQTNNSVIEKYCYNDDPNNCTTYGGLYRME